MDHPIAEFKNPIRLDLSLKCFETMYSPEFIHDVLDTLGSIPASKAPLFFLERP
jgi:hypothetical protein